MSEYNLFNPHRIIRKSSPKPSKLPHNEVLTSADSVSMLFRDFFYSYKWSITAP